MSINGLIIITVKKMGKLYSIRKTGEVVEVIDFSDNKRRTANDFVAFIDSDGREREEPMNIYWDMEEFQEDEYNMHQRALVRFAEIALRTELDKAGLPELKDGNYMYNIAVRSSMMAKIMKEALFGDIVNVNMEGENEEDDDWLRKN